MQSADARDYAYVSFDDDVTLAAAKADPVGFVGGVPARGRRPRGDSLVLRMDSPGYHSTSAAASADS